MLTFGLIEGLDSKLIFSKSSRNDWLNFYQSCDIMLYLVGREFENNSGSIKNCG